MGNMVTIVGQGYVGLPLAQAASMSNWAVNGYDLSSVVISGLRSGTSHIDDVSDDEVQAMLENSYTPTSDPCVIADSDVVIICVPTPLGEAGAPDLGYVESATQMVGENLKRGALIILESTTYPGTTEDICVPLLEAYSGMKLGADFHVAFSPERVNPGSKKFGIKNTPKLVGGVLPEATILAAEFYRTFIDEVVPMSGAKEAETAKLLENTFRHVNIALVNEMAKVCHELDIDIWEVLRGAGTKPFGFMKFSPGSGVGGHCIPIDPNYLSYEVRRQLGYPLRFVELAQEINNSMPSYVVSRVNEKLNEQKQSLNGAKVLLLGVTYKANIADQRQSPAVPVAMELLNRGVNLMYHDPFVSEWTLDNGEKLHTVDDYIASIEDADVVVLLQNHEQYAIQEIERSAKLLLDTCGISAIEENRL